VIGAGGSIAVALVRRRLGSFANVPARVGAKIGGATGLLSFSVPALMVLLGFVIDGPAVHEEFVQYIKTAASQIADPRSRDSLQNVLQAINTPEGFATFITLSIALSFLFFLALGAAGGAIGASLMQRDRSGR